jgi:ketosteroid isomerase-like protein
VIAMPPLRQAVLVVALFVSPVSTACLLAQSSPRTPVRGVRDTSLTTPPDAAPDSSQSGALFDELARMDSLVFAASYVTCDTARVNALLADDVEFYHDVSGLHRGDQVRADFARLAQNCPFARGVRRELVPGSLHVYPIRGFGAVQTGTHRFIERGATTATTARFVHVWRKDGDGWRVSRVLSLDHHPTALP